MTLNQSQNLLFTGDGCKIVLRKQQQGNTDKRPDLSEIQSGSGKEIKQRRNNGRKQQSKESRQMRRKKTPERR